MYTFLENNKLIYKKQFGFRRAYSVNHALISITERIRNLLDNQNYVYGTFIDSEKAFDTVNLCDKLNFYGHPAYSPFLHLLHVVGRPCATARTELAKSPHSRGLEYKASHERYWYRWKCLSPCSLAEKQTNYIAPSVFSLYRAKANGWRHWFLLIYSEPVKRRRLKQTMLRSLIMYDDKSNFRFVILTICVRSKQTSCMWCFMLCLGGEKHI